jgi:hypothetical protein
VCTPTAGVRNGSPAISEAVDTSGSPPLIRHTSVEVPPMSKAIASSKPADRATAPAATTPAAGPDSRVCTGAVAAKSMPAVPPLEVITVMVGSVTRSVRWDR